MPHLELRTVTCPQTACHPGRVWPSELGAGVPHGSKSGCGENWEGEEERLESGAYSLD